MTLDKSKMLYAHVVLDRSGSMASIRKDAVGGYNEYVRGLPAESTISLTIFDTGGIDLIRDAVSPGAGIIADGEFIPRGGTPLYDAIGRVVGEMDVRSKDYGKVALVILTDGEENSSREFTRDKIAALIKAKQDAGWLVIYLGANQDAWAVGSAMGTTMANTMAYVPQNIGATLRSASAATARYSMAANRSEGIAASTFTDAERKSAKE